MKTPRVGRHVAARVVAHQQHRALGRDAVAGRAPRRGSRGWRAATAAGSVLADVVGVALVEVGLRHARLGLLGHRADGQRGRRAPGAREPSAEAHRRCPRAVARARRRPLRGRRRWRRRCAGCAASCARLPCAAQARARSVRRRGHDRRPRRRRAGGPGDLVRLARRQARAAGRASPAQRRAARPRCARAVSITSWRRRPGSSGCGPSRRGPPRSAGSAPPRCRCPRTFRASCPSRRPLAARLSSRRPVERVGRARGSVARRGRVQADHQVEPAAGEQVEVRRPSSTPPST